jgi:hypothetical protein
VSTKVFEDWLIAMILFDEPVCQLIVVARIQATTNEQCELIRLDVAHRVGTYNNQWPQSLVDAQAIRAHETDKGIYV